jgi:hypothetical protein
MNTDYANLFLGLKKTFDAIINDREAILTCQTESRPFEKSPTGP